MMLVGRGVDMAVWRVATAIVIALASIGEILAQGAAVVSSSPERGAIALVDSSGNAAARPLTETVMLVTLGGGVIAPAQIRAIYGSDGRAASGLATWHSGGSVLFTSADCTTGAHVYSSSYAGVRASTQVQTAAGIVLFVGAIGPSITEAIQSILYDTGCATVAVRQNGLVPVVTSVNLTTTYPPPLSFQ
jgi:hypothetical protein